MPRKCIGKKTRLKVTKVIAQWILPHRSLIIRPNIFGYQ
jgi:hypothetical protein